MGTSNWNFSSGWAAMFLALAFAALPSCTTNFETALAAHDQGQFALAAREADTLCPTVVKDGSLRGFERTRDCDEQWIGLQKATILADAGELVEARRVGEWTAGRALAHRDKESWYLRNPIDPRNWDGKQFLRDAGQAIAGADQTDFELQPHELILLEAYLGVNDMLAGDRSMFLTRGATIAKLQAEEQTDLMASGQAAREPPVDRMDGIIKGALPSGAQTDFSARSIFSLGDFTGAKQRMDEAISNAQAAGAANRVVASATMVSWALAMAERENTRAAAAARLVGTQSGASRLSDEMMRLAKTKNQEFVAVMIDSGRGPARGWFQIRLPIVIPNVGIGTFRAVYPSLVFRGADRPERMSVRSGDQAVQAEALTSVDALAAFNFRRREATLWWTPTIRAAIRTITSLVAQASQQDNQNAALAIALAGIVLAEVEQPDLRMWSTLPATQHAAIVARPPSGKIVIELESPSDKHAIEVEVPPGASFVHVRALTPRLVNVRSASLYAK